MLKTPIRVGVAVAALALAASACSSSSSKKVSTASAPAAQSGTPTTVSFAPPTTADPLAALQAIGPAAASSFTVSLAKGPEGIFLIGPNGHTLYIHTTDKGTTTSCAGACLTAWPPLTASGPVTGGPAVTAAQLGTAAGNQVTYYGHLLYYFVNDKAVGDTTGAAIPTWLLLGPFGNEMQPK
jgi:predicted lipoprotein with Yx(FWY)xxD motif